ncbi:hypothetical protein JNUCC0626_50195 (plasmid) [Lentzea sp. JNUCC 0626]|uniref:hypothetical protein n=1 Tax=Lentzea sp. JNUCC 0626 TaxID=3367513 RepID=UPI003747B9F2
MSEQSRDPIRMAHELDMLELGNEQFWETNRTQFEEMARRHSKNEAEVADKMRFYDQHRGQLGSWASSAAREDGAPTTDGSLGSTPPPPAPEQRAEPQAAPTPPRPRPQPRSRPVDDVETEDEDEDPVRIRPPRFEFDMQPTAPAPGRATRLMHAPKLYGKALAIGLLIAAVLWFIVTGGLHWLFDSAWWGWWPGVPSVLIAAIGFAAWMYTAHQDIRYWLRNGGPRMPLRMRLF